MTPPEKLINDLIKEDSEVTIGDYLKLLDELELIKITTFLTEAEEEYFEAIKIHAA